MPVTTHPCSKAVETVSNRYDSLKTAEYYTKNPFEIVRSRFPKNGEVFQCSFPLPSKDCSQSDNIAATNNLNGFVDTAVQAYNQHHHLVIRPDDVWIAILSQFNFFVNANAEKLRHLFVAHKGKKELTVSASGTRYTVDFGSMAKQMGDKIQENVIDPSLREWIMPEFTTTTPNDTIISSVIMMSTLKEYFSYRFMCMCGLPAVTLLGEKEDWEKILDKIEKLKEYGSETTRWYHLLRSVLSEFVNTFDHPEADSTKDFWQKIADYRGGGSGPTYLSGWITAFCFFSSKGRPLGSGGKGPSLTLNGVTFGQVDSEEVPAAYAEVPVLLDDNGVKIKTVMIAGLVGMRVSGENKGTVQAQPAWWIAEEIENEGEDKET